MSLRWALIASVGMGLAGCVTGGRGVQDPSSVLHAYAAALEAGRADDAYGLLSQEARRELTIEAFRSMVRDNPAEAREIARALARPSSPPLITATVSGPNGEPLGLVYESGHWKIDGSAINLYAQSTPRQAVSAFVRAFERRRYDVLMRFVPEAKRAGLDAHKLQAAWEGSQKADIERIAQAVKAALPGASFEEVGDRATMPFGALGTVQLVREHGVWKIEDFD